MLPMNEPSLSQVYQRLVREETRAVVEFGFEDGRSILTRQNIGALASDSDLKELVEAGLLVDYRHGYRTSHIDLIHRIIQIRNLEPQRPIPFEHKIVAKEELVPDFDANRFEDIIPSLIPDHRIAGIIASVLKTASTYRGLSSHQLPLVKQLLSFRSKHVAIVAPTASGKTLTFFLPALVVAIERSLKGISGISTILTYPRKALGRDQLKGFLSLIDSTNQILEKNGNPPITLGIDDNDTPRRREMREGTSYHKIKCLSCKGELFVRSIGDRMVVSCNQCKKKYPYILPTKDEIWETRPTFLITNLWIVYRRMLSQRTVGMFKNLDYVITDEAHTYTHFLGGHISYVLKLLSLAANHNGRPVFVFSSATVANPSAFIASLSGVREDDLFFVDYNTSLRDSPGTKAKRLLLHLYLLPHPQSDIETLTEVILLATTLWTHKRRTKGIVFIDSIAEINTIRDYIDSTILGTREGREVSDHIFQTERVADNTYCWETLAPSDYTSDLLSFKKFVGTTFKKSIDMHYGGLSQDKRAQVENAFTSGDIRMLLSTSTLELGMNLSDVAVIIQHKLPMTPEGVVQRIGRAGRDETCNRIALGIIVLPAWPLSTLYMYDDRLRETLESVENLPPLRIGKSSENLSLQYTLSFILLKRALQGKSTYVDMDTEGLRNKADVLNVTKVLMKELETIGSSSTQLESFLGKEAGTKAVHTMKLLLGSLEQGLENLGDLRYGQEYENLNSFQANLDRQIGLAYDIQEQFRELREEQPRLTEMPPVWHETITQAEGSLRSLIGRFRDLARVLKTATYQNDARIIGSWWIKNRPAIGEVQAGLLTGEKTFQLSNDLMQHSAQLGFSKFKTKYGVDPNRLLRILAQIGQDTGNDDTGLCGFLKGLDHNIEQARTVQLDSLSAFRALQRFENDAKLALGGKLEVFQTLSLLLEGKAHFSLLFNAPSPDLELVGVEES